MYTVLETGALGHNLPLEERVRLAMEYGFDGVKVGLVEAGDIGVEKVRNMLKAAGLRNGGAGMPFSLVGDEGEYKEGLAGLPRQLEAAEAIGCDRLSTWLPSWSDERDFDDNFAFHVERIRPVADMLRERGMRLALEFLGPKTLREGHRFEFIHTMEGMLKLCDAVGGDVAGLLLDSWHWYTSGGTPEDILRMCKGRVVDVHVNDAPPGVARDEQIDNRRLLPGASGVIDMRVFLGALRRVGYDGPVMVEPFYEPLCGMEPEDAVRAAADALMEVWVEAGLT